MSAVHGPETAPEDRPLTMRDLVDLLGDGGAAEPEAKPAGRVAGAPRGHSLAWFKGNWNTPVSQLSDAELDKLAAEVN